MSKSSEVATLVMSSPVGVLRLTASARGVKSIEVIKGSRVANATVPRNGAGAIVRQAEKELREYFSGRRQKFTVKLDLDGTEFQRTAWEAMRRIPFGSTIPIIVPCHRVLASDGSLGGYSLGLSMKRRLLALEGVSVAG
ncbi:MAG: methylated-DNA--[protein]-cysteine S-methyltransferase [Actinobacteria bacterium]|nr:methylated-DNA--[protein]-cysteine S-methyltransferase [Actinomycetota bacterium]